MGSAAADAPIAQGKKILCSGKRLVYNGDECGSSYEPGGRCSQEQHHMPPSNSPIFTPDPDDEKFPIITWKKFIQHGTKPNILFNETLAMLNGGKFREKLWRGLQREIPTSLRKNRNFTVKRIPLDVEAKKRIMNKYFECLSHRHHYFGKISSNCYSKLTNAFIARIWGVFPHGERKMGNICIHI